MFNSPISSFYKFLLISWVLWSQYNPLFLWPYELMATTAPTTSVQEADTSWKIVTWAASFTSSLNKNDLQSCNKMHP